jgi:predicted nucleic acid-binding protein
MKMVVDVNIVLAVVLGEPEREWAIKVSRNATAFAPKSFPFELGNALSALFKRKRLSNDGVLAAWRAAAKYQVTLCDIDMAAALRLACVHNIYAYDAYIVQCAVEQKAVLMSLDRRMIAIAKGVGLDVMEP